MELKLGVTTTGAVKFTAQDCIWDKDGAFLDRIAKEKVDVWTNKTLYTCEGIQLKSCQCSPEGRMLIWQQQGDHADIICSKCGETLCSLRLREKVIAEAAIQSAYPVWRAMVRG